MPIKRTQYLAIRNMQRGFGLLILFLLVFGAAFSWLTWKTEKEDQSRYLSSIAELAGKSLDVYFSQFESAFDLLGQQLLEENNLSNLERIQTFLNRFHQANPNFQVVNLVHPDGQILASTAAYTGEPLASVGKVPSFLTGRDALLTGEKLNLGQPSVGLMAKEWAIPFQYAIRGKNNELLYILHAALPLNKQQSFWQDLLLRDDTAIGVQRDDGFLLTRYPAPVVSG
jgi:hypothetical protein